MDHLPSRGLSAPIEVPYLCLRAYDSGPPASFPERNGWDKEKVFRGDFGGRPIAETTSLLQFWMYFGHLFEVLDVLGAHFDPWHFIQTLQDGKRLITTPKLGTYVLSCCKRECNYDREQKSTRSNAINNCFKDVHRFVMRYCCRESWRYHAQPDGWPLSPEVSFSIIVLADSLMKAGFEITGQAFSLNGV
ncbi:hypothetical protein MMC12_003554 [Toensbergia leucococca]|nr:hypothetical protein [Toensbergia leucococca]